MRYHPSHVSRLLWAIGWSPQKPVMRATQRDQAAIASWYAQRWPALKTGAQRRGQTIVRVDESGFYLLPAVVRTYAPQTQTPVLHVPLTRDHLSVISGITPDDRLLLMVHAHAIRGPEVVRFLKHLLRHIPGQVLVIWDAAPIHHGKAVQAFLADGGAARLQLEILPGYAPDLNPDEGIWNY